MKQSNSNELQCGLRVEVAMCLVTIFDISRKLEYNNKQAHHKEGLCVVSAICAKVNYSLVCSRRMNPHRNYKVCLSEMYVIANFHATCEEFKKDFQKANRKIFDKLYI